MPDSPFSRPRHVRPLRLTTRRGDFAALRAAPAHGPHRGTVLLLPGYTGGKEEFVPLLPHLVAAGYQAVAVDARGQNETAGPDDEAAYRQDALAMDVLAQAETLGGPVHLLGHSMGGHLARAAVLADPRPFASLTLLSSGPAQVGEERQLQLKLLLQALETLTMAQVWDMMRESRPAPVSPEEARHLRARWLRTHVSHLRVVGRQLLAEPDRTPELAALTQLPKHVVYGDADDTWTTWQLEDMAARLEAHRTILAGAGHSPNLQRPAETATSLIGFWSGIPRG
ncbi:alpha/beta fold hydrolase [Streptomyces chromofuscus]|uniref:alpha/beta fold hydrolase n=1 Tax=Streptomyces chromofuscus TaxID=42881 RepID=UPI0016728E47|nr:alpha/beta hydrolase [Streptomyces chromofuscus]GGT03309.1 alpha/beta hydrolase [Streptomyces chromofuscus]